MITSTSLQNVSTPQLPKLLSKVPSTTQPSTSSNVLTQQQSEIHCTTTIVTQSEEIATTPSYSPARQMHNSGSKKLQQQYEYQSQNR